MDKIISQVFNHASLKDHPPVLVDIGASGSIHGKWNKIAKYCICVAYDADDREFSISEDEKNGFKKLYTFNCIVSDQETAQLDFYLTANPYCSSTLKPNPATYSKYVYSDNFILASQTKINNISLQKSLEKLNLTRVDWFKTDSQGMDLRLYKNLPADIQKNAIVVEFEPGLMPSYFGEDTAQSILAYMENMDFWLSGFDVQGIIKGNKQQYESLFTNPIYKKLAKATIKKAPKWVEMTYINSLSGENVSIRDYLLGCIFSMIEKEHLNVLHLVEKAKLLFKDDIFNEIQKATLSEIEKGFVDEKVLSEVGKKIKNLFK